MLDSLFDPEIPFDRAWNGPNTMETLPTVPQGLGIVFRRFRRSGETNSRSRSYPNP